MITQIIKQGTHEIRIETAESIEDAEKHKFPASTYSRYFVDDKRVDNYHLLIKFIVAEAKENNSKAVLDIDGIMKQREAMFRKQFEDAKKQIEQLKKQYEGLNLPEITLRSIDEMLEKLDPETNIRVMP